MPTATVNGVRLFYELSGAGQVPAVLVHGSWDSHADWDAIRPFLEESFQVLAYDRRGHSRSERPVGPGSIDEDVDDLAALIEHLALAPAWVIGNSFGASITLRLAGRRPDLLRGLVAHEPPLLSLIADDPGLAPLMDDVNRRFVEVIEQIEAGEHAGAAEWFVENVALGPGMWAEMPPENRQTLIENAPTFLDESRDPQSLQFDLDWIRRLSKPAMLTQGDASPPMFAPIVARLAEANPRVQVATIRGAGHIPHVTHPADYARAIIDFTRKHG